MITKLVYAIENLNVWVGRAFGWCILVLTLSVSYEVFMRYVLNAPTVWAFDMMIQMYGALFLMAGPYALAQDAHVRGDVLYRLFPIRWQARIDFTLYLLFFFPGILALVWFGFEIAGDSWRFKDLIALRHNPILVRNTPNYRASNVRVWTYLLRYDKTVLTLNGCFGPTSNFPTKPPSSSRALPTWPEMTAWKRKSKLGKLQKK